MRLTKMALSSTVLAMSLALPTWGQEPYFSGKRSYYATHRIMGASFQEDPFKEKGDKNGNGKEKDNGKEKEEKGPEHTRDNGFLVEEAVNQEKGVVQHIFNLVHFWDRPSLGRTRDMSFAYTMELPLGSQKHQFSFAPQFISSFSKVPRELPTQEAGFGDLLLNYRYQLLDDDEFLWCAPRFSLLLPTGDERFGTGNGQLGYQFNLPLSHYGQDWDVHFNAGVTHVPRVRVPLPNGLTSPRRDLTGYNLGASAFYKLNFKLHLLIEVLAFWNQEIDDLGERNSLTQVLVDPGFRYTLFQSEEVEWVVGLGLPLGLNRDAPDIGVFGYMSVEHGFRKSKNGNGAEKD